MPQPITFGSVVIFCISNSNSDHKLVFSCDGLKSIFVAISTSNRREEV
jgi:hypothetical protein